MDLTQNKDFSDFQNQVVTDNQEELDAFSASRKKSYFTKAYDFTGSAVSGTGKGAVNAATDIFDSLTDVGFMVGIKGADKMVGYFDREIDETQVLEDMQGFRDGMTSYIRSEESDDKVANFFMNTTESVGKFAYFYKKLATTGMSKIAAVGGAGVLEGATNNPERDMMIMDKTLRGGINMVSPKLANDFDKALDMSTDPNMAKQLTRRIMSGLEMGVLSVAGEKVAGKVGEGIEVGVETAKKHIPDSVKKPMLDAYGKVLERSVAVKRWMQGGQKGSLDDAIRTFLEGTPDITYNNTKFNPELSARENIKNTMTVSFDPTMNIKDADQYTRMVTDYEKKLEEVAPQLYNDIVSMSKSRGISEEEGLANYARELGINEADKFTAEKFKETLKAQAHNIMFEQQSMAFVTAKSNLDQGVISEGDFLEATKGLLTTFTQRQALLSKAGTVMRTGQEIDPAAMALNKELRSTTKEISDVQASYGGMLDDPESLKIIGTKLNDILQLNHAVGGSADKIYKNMQKAFKKYDPEKPKAVTAREIANSFSTVYTANLLSGLTTLSQNTLGSFAQLNVQAMDTVFKAGYSKIAGRQAGDATFREAGIQFQNLYMGHVYAVGLSLRTAANYATGKGGGMFTNNMANIPEMANYQKQSMMRMNKEDMTTTGNTVIERIAKSNIGYVATGKPIFDIIRLQDITTKNVGAKMHLHGRWNTALYTDDAFNLKGNATDVLEAQKIYNKKFLDGEDTFTAEEIKRAGIKDPLLASLELKRWRSRTSEDAAQFGIEGAMQQGLNPAMKQLQHVLQDVIPFAGRVMIPFFQTPVNIISDALRRAPMIPIGEDGSIGLPIHPRFYKDFMKGGAHRADAVARLTTGVTVMELGRQLTEQGVMTAVPHDKLQAATLDQAVGTPAGSVLINNQQYSTAAFGPMGILLNLGSQQAAFDAKYGDKMAHLNDDDVNKFTDHILFNASGVMEVVRNNPWAQGFDTIAEFIETNWEDENAVKKLQEGLAKTAGNLVPYSSLQRQISSHLMEEQKRANGLKEQFLSSFAPYENHTSYNTFGEERKTNSDTVLRNKSAANDETMMLLYMYSGFDGRPAKFDQTVQGRNGQPSVKINLKKEQWDDFNKFTAETGIRKRLDSFIRSDFAKMNVSTGNIKRNKSEVEGQIRKSRQFALQRVIEKYPDLVQDITDKQKKKFAKDAVTPTAPAGGNKMIEFMGGM